MERERDPRPWVTVGLLVIVGGLWVAITLQGRSLQATEEVDRLRQWGAVLRPELWATGEFWRLFTANFLHIGLVHLVLNSLSLWWVGKVVEFLYGPRKMLYIYLVAGVAGSVCSAVFGPPWVVSAGASGAIFGLLGAVIWYRLSSPLGARIAWRPLLTTLVLNLGLGLALHRVVDNWNHVGGLVGGFVAAVTVGTPVVAGAALPRFFPRRPVRLLAAGVLLVAAAAVVGGMVDLPGPGRDLHRAMVLYDAGRVGEALVGIRRAVAHQPEDADLRFFLAQALYRNGQCRAAEVELKSVLSLEPGYPGASELAQRLRACKS